MPSGAEFFLLYYVNHTVACSTLGNEESEISQESVESEDQPYWEWENYPLDSLRLATANRTEYIQ